MGNDKRNNTLKIASLEGSRDRDERSAEWLISFLPKSGVKPPDLSVGYITEE